jgi:hypothetical protein
MVGGERMKKTLPIIALFFLIINCAPAQVLIGVRTDKISYNIGEPIRITITIKNPTNKDVVLTSRSGNIYDIWVERNFVEVWRWSKGRLFAQSVKTIAMRPYETKRFYETWNQTRNINGRQVPEGSYYVNAGLNISNGPMPARAYFTIKLVLLGSKTTISQIVSHPDFYKYSTVVVKGRSLGWRPYPNSPACKPGPPVTRSDWVLADGRDCIYVYGSGGRSVSANYGKSLIVQARVLKTSRGQVYLEAKRIIENPNVP